MLTGKELGAAIDAAIKLKIQSGTIRSRADVARHFNVKPPSVYDWISRGVISKDKIPELISYFSDVVSYSHWGLSEKHPFRIYEQNNQLQVWENINDLENNDERVWVDRWDYKVSAGNGVIQWEIRQKQALPFNRSFFKEKGSKPENTKLLIVKGDSMEPYLFNGDLIMIDITKTDIKDGQIYAVMFEGDALVKKVFKESGGVLVLHSLNTAKFRDKIVTPSENTDFKVIGEVIYRSG